MTAAVSAPSPNIVIQRNIPRFVVSEHETALYVAMDDDLEQESGLFTTNR